MAQLVGVARFTDHGRIDAVLAAVLGLMSVALGLLANTGWIILADLLVAVLAGLTGRWPRVAGLTLGLVLVGYLFLPPDSQTLGEYAPLIPILGAGIRGQRRVRVWMTVGYGALLVLLTYRDYRREPVDFVLGVLVWAALIGAVWLVGNVFTSYRRAQQDAAAYSVMEERLSLARELHDTTARTLARVLLRAQQAEGTGDPDRVIEELSVGIRQASEELRRSLVWMRAPSDQASGDDVLRALVEQACESLDQSGFSTATSFAGDFRHLPQPISAVLAAALGEAVANIERHGRSDQPCAIHVRATGDEVNLVVMNEVSDGRRPQPARFGLVGIAERLAPLGGELEAMQEDSTWLMRIRVPIKQPA